MAVDRGYGSGKPRSAANSASRRAAADKAASRKKTIKRQASNPGVRLGVSRIGKTENAGFNIGGRQYLESGVGGWKMIAAAIAKMAPRVGGAFDGSGSNALRVTADMAAKGNKAAQKRIFDIVNRSVTSFNVGVAGNIAKGGSAPSSRSLANMSRPGLRVYERGLAKVFGRAGGSEPGFRAMGKTAREASAERYMETTFPRGIGKGYTYDRYAGTPTTRLPDGSIKVKNTKIDEYGNEFPRPGFKRMVRRGR